MKFSYLLLTLLLGLTATFCEILAEPGKAVTIDFSEKGTELFHRNYKLITATRVDTVFLHLKNVKGKLETELKPINAECSGFKGIQLAGTKGEFFVRVDFEQKIEHLYETSLCRMFFIEGDTGRLVRVDFGEFESRPPDSYFER